LAHPAQPNRLPGEAKFSVLEIFPTSADRKIAHFRE